MEKLKFTFNKSEVRTLFHFISIANFNEISDPVKRVLVRHVLEKIYFNLAKYLIRNFEKASFSYHPAEALSLYEILNTIDEIDLPDYERTLKHRITDEIHAKYII